MLFGNKESFGIEYNLDADYGGPWLFGKVCYWIDKIMVGNYDLGTSLRDVLMQSKNILGDSGNRYGGILCDIDNEDAFIILKNFFFNESVINEENLLKRMPDQPARFNVTIPVDVFDDYQIFLIQCDLKSEIIMFNDNNQKIIHTKKLQLGEFDNVFRNFFDNLNVRYDKENRSFANI